MHFNKTPHTNLIKFVYFKSKIHKEERKTSSQLTLLRVSVFWKREIANQRASPDI